MKLPIVRRVSHEAAVKALVDQHNSELSDVSAAHSKQAALLEDEIATLRATLLDVKQSARAETQTLRADRNRILAKSERLRSTHEVLKSEAAALRVLAKERNVFQSELRTIQQHQVALERTIVEYESECTRLSELELKMRDQLARSELSIELAQQQAQNLRNECDRLGAAESSKIKELAQAGIELENLKQQIHEYQADCDSLKEVTSGLQDELAHAKNNVSAAKQQADSFKNECERLGKESVRLFQENLGLTTRLENSASGYREITEKLRAAYQRNPLMIGTFPRSGTWMLKYFFYFLDHYSRKKAPPDIKKLHKTLVSKDVHELRFRRSKLPSQMITVSHWMCPGVFSLPDEQTTEFKSLLHHLGCFDYQEEQGKDNMQFDPIFGRSKIVFVYRNPFDVYRSYADIFERRSAMPDRQTYPFNPMTPFGTELMNSESDRPFEFFIEGFKGSNFTEYFAAYFMSFLHMKDAYPDQVHILPFEQAKAERKDYLEKIVAYGKIGDLNDAKFGDAFEKAYEATDLSKMRQYEQELGHAISGSTTFYGEANPTHLSTKKRDWRSLYTEADFEFMRTKLNEIAPRVLDYLPEVQQLSFDLSS